MGTRLCARAARRDLGTAGCRMLIEGLAVEGGGLPRRRRGKSRQEPRGAERHRAPRGAARVPSPGLSRK